MWTFNISAGQLLQDGEFVGDAYAGAPGYTDDPAAEDLVNKGPLPEGWYTMLPPVDKPYSVGAYAIELVPDATNDMHGRSGFFCHGDNPQGNHSASDGCIVALRVIRERMWDSGDHRLQVVSGLMVTDTEIG